MLKKQDIIAAYSLVIIGTIQLILLLLTILGFTGDMFTALIYNSFHIAAVYIPGLFFFGAFLIAKKPFDKQLFYNAIASIFIFFPVSTILKILLSDKKDPVINFFHDYFDTSNSNLGSVFILLGITAILALSARIIIKRALREGEDTVATHDVQPSTPIINTVAKSEESESLPIKGPIYFEEEPQIEEPVVDDLESSNSYEDNSVQERVISNEEFEPEDIEEAENIDPDEENELGLQIAKIRSEISEYYANEEKVEEVKNIPFEEPIFPENTEEVDIEALDESNSILSNMIETELTKEESEYIDSFDEVETFNVNHGVLLDEDPGIAFLADDNEYEQEETLDNSWHESQSNEEETQDYYAEEQADAEQEIVPEVESYLDHDSTPEVETQNYEEEVESYIETESTGRVLEPETKTYNQLNPVEDEYVVPIQGVLKAEADHSYEVIDEATKRSAAILEQTLEEFNIKGKVTGIKKGPVITMFELLPAPGVKLSKIVNLADNIALGLAASNVRIVAPIPGKHAVGIEVPNKKRSVVTFSELIDAENETYNEGAIPIVLGKSINGDNKIIDLAKTPHLLIAGATGAGKSVCVNSLICSILCKRSHNDVKLIMVDPKIVELKLYNGIPHLLTPVITDPKRAFQAIQWCLFEMERRYALLDSMGVRDILSYNRRIKEQKIATTKIPYLVLIVDEFADLMATSGKELEGILARLAAMSRAVGIHLVLATQRPSIDVITGLIKANFPSRIAFMVSSKTDSRIILDGMGAEKLLGRGDMLFSSSWDPFPVRIQGSFLSDEEVESVVDYVKQLGEPEYIDDEIFIDDDEEGEEDSDKSFFGDDPLYNRALEIVITAKKASASFLQRRLKIGYNRAARLVEEMEERGIIGPQNGSKPRDILKIPESHKDVSEYV